MLKKLQELKKEKEDFSAMIKKENILISNEHVIDLGKELYSRENDFYLQLIKKPLNSKF